MVDLKSKRYLKKTIPFMTAFTIAICFAIAINNEMTYERSALKATAKQELQIVAAKVESLFAQSIETTLGVKAYFEENPDFSNPALVSYTERLLGEQGRILRTLALTDVGIIKFIYPLKGNEVALNGDLLSLPSKRDITLQTLKNQGSNLLGPIKVIQGWEAFIFMSALDLTDATSGPSQGLITVTLDHNELLAEAGITHLLNHYQIQLVSVNADFSERILFVSNRFNKESSVSVEIYPYNQHWKLSAHPVDGWGIRSGIVFMMIGAGTLISGSAYYIIYALIRKNDVLDKLVASRTQDLVYTNNELQESLALNEERQAELEILNERLEMTIVELKYTVSKLNATEKAKVISDLIAGVAHRINTPIGNILTMVSYIKDQLSAYYENKPSSDTTRPECVLIPNIEESIGIIDKSIAKAISIISNFESLSSINSESDIEIFNVNRIIDDLIGELSLITSVQIQNEMDTECYLNANKNVVSQIIHNIMQTILEYHSSQGVTTVHIDVSLINGLSVLNIRTLPLNMPQEVIDNPFDPHLFIPVNSKLTGLELFIASQLASEVLGGDLKFSSKERDEQQFTLYVPEACKI